MRIYTLERNHTAFPKMIAIINHAWCERNDDFIPAAMNSDLSHHPKSRHGRAGQKNRPAISGGPDCRS
jgi:hypothetical protein